MKPGNLFESGANTGSNYLRWMMRERQEKFFSALS